MEERRNGLGDENRVCVSVGSIAADPIALEGDRLERRRYKSWLGLSDRVSFSFCSRIVLVVVSRTGTRRVGTVVENGQNQQRTTNTRSETYRKPPLIVPPAQLKACLPRT